MKASCSRATRTLALALMLLLAAAPCFIGVRPAHAVISFGEVAVSLPSSAVVTAGQTTSVSCVVTPASHAQLPNCFTTYCPSGCEFGSSGGCLDADGQCTCFGGGYTTYYPNVSVSSSNPAVARAAYSGGALVITGYTPGTATITVRADLRLWTSAAASVAVTVTEPAAPSTGGSEGTEPSGSGSASSGSASGAGSAAQGGVSVSSQGVSATSSAGKVATAVVSGGQAVVEEGAADETQPAVHSAEVGQVDALELLASIAGTEDEACFWQGPNADEAEYVWTFSGQALADADLGAFDALDLTVNDLTSENERLAAALGKVAYRAVGFEHEGALPCAATLGVRVSDAFANGTRLALYFYDEAADALVLVEKGLEVTEGYVTFSLDHTAVWVLSDDTGLEGPLASADDEQEDAVAQVPDEENQSAMPVAALLAVALGVVVIAAAGVAVARKRRAGAIAPDAQAADSERAAEEAAKEE